jgi:hypothetical protein
MLDLVHFSDEAWLHLDGHIHRTAISGQVKIRTRYQEKPFHPPELQCGVRSLADA